MMTGASRSWALAAVPRVASNALAIAALVTIGACAQAPQVPRVEPLAIEQPGTWRTTARPSTALVSGRLMLAENGRSKVPYQTTLDTECMLGHLPFVAVYWLLIPFPGIDCTTGPPAATLVHLESRRAATLRAAADGRFQAYLPPGTYLVHGISTGTAMMVPVALAFQADAAGRSYYLGDAHVDYRSSYSSSGRDARVASVDVRDVEGGDGAATSRALFIPLDRFEAPRAPEGTDADESWNRYLDGIIAELDRKGLHLVTAELTP